MIAHEYFIGTFELTLNLYLYNLSLESFSLILFLSSSCLTSFIQLYPDVFILQSGSLTE